MRSAPQQPIVPLGMGDASRPLWHPRYWLVWFGVVLGWILAQLPHKARLISGRGLGMLIYRFAGGRRRIAETNLALCFPALPARERAHLVRSHFRSLGMGVIETAMAWWTPTWRMRELVRIEGLEHLDAALEEGRGALLLNGHFTTLEIGGKFMSLCCGYRVMYRPHDNAAFEYVVRTGRERSVEGVLSREDLRGVLRTLKANIPVWYAPDQDHGSHGRGVFVDFLGVPTATVTATARLAGASGARVVPFFTERREKEGDYLMRIHPALTDFPTGDPLADAQRISDIIAAEVGRRPADYFWIHRRFKTRPEGAPPVYGKPR